MIIENGRREIAFVTDFDGTITDDDFFQYVKDAFLDESALAPWQLYLEGKTTHFEALKQIYGSLRVSEDELVDLVKKVSVDEWLIPTFEMLHNAQIPIYIASAGCDYYINLLIGDIIDKYGVRLVTNDSSYTQGGGLLMEKPLESSYYDENVGISKRKIIAQLKESGWNVVFAGDGPPDIEPARLADIVFAKKILLDKCMAEGISIEGFNSYRDIYRYFALSQGLLPQAPREAAL